jgi:hypothetical protein
MPSHPARLISCRARANGACERYTTIAALRRRTMLTRGSRKLLDRLLKILKMKILKNGLISSMYATAQKCFHINGILEKLLVGTKFSRQNMLL